MDSDTPRSGYGTPRDDRFYTPRSFSHSNSSNSDEWTTPRDASFKGGPGYNSQSDSEYKTPRLEQDDAFHSSRSSASPRQYQPSEAKASGSLADREEEDFSQFVSDQDVEDIFSYARHGRCDDIDRLLNRGIPVDVRDEYGNTLLTIASQNGNKRVAKTVLRRGGNINARNHKGNTPLHYCFHCELELLSCCALLSCCFCKIIFAVGYGESLGQYLISKVRHPQSLLSLLIEAFRRVLILP